MYRRILVPTDGTELCSLALDTALRLAKLGGGAIVGLHVYSTHDPAGPPAGSVDPALAAWRDEREQQGRDALAYVRRRADSAGVPCETVLVTDAAPFEAIERAAHEHGCDLVVMATHAHRGLRARLLGSSAERLIAHGSVPLLIVR
jgi:nucleotide-binding universal stress UspA family protein